MSEKEKNNDLIMVDILSENDKDEWTDGNDLIIEEKGENFQEYFQESIKKSVDNSESKKEKDDLKKQALKTIKDYEKNIIDLKDSRIKLLKYGLFSSIFVSICLVISLIVLMPLKESVPYLLRVDKTTGYVDKVEPYNASQGTVDEAVIRYFLARYIENREAYDWNVIQSMYDTTQALSSNDVFASYNNLYLSDYSPLRKLKDKAKMIPVVNSIVFLNDNTAQIRFTKAVEDNKGELIPDYPVTSWIATVAFDFSKTVSTEKQRMVNPLGFRVVSYKLDSEVKK